MTEYQRFEQNMKILSKRYSVICYGDCLYGVFPKSYEDLELSQAFIFFK